MNKEEKAFAGVIIFSLVMFILIQIMQVRYETTIIKEEVEIVQEEEVPASVHVEPQREPDSKGVQGVAVRVTTYNPEVGQTDASPCIGAIGVDVCEAYAQGRNPIAISQDLIYGTRGHYCRENCAFRYGDIIKVVSDEPQCNLQGVLLDTMNSRHTNAADLFKPDRSLNTSCQAIISKIN